IVGRLAAYLEKKSGRRYHPCAVPDPEAFRRSLRPCDIILMEGDLRYSEIIKYVTQSTWSHCGIYIGDAFESDDLGDDQRCIIEVLLTDGTVLSPIKDYYGFNTRILRPIGLTKTDKDTIIAYCLERLGHSYDIANVIDLLKHHVPFFKLFFGNTNENEPFGSGDPQKVICSSLIAQAFQSVSYPILPDIEKLKKSAARREGTTAEERMRTESETLSKRHHSLFSPRDFDMSPFFAVVKPTIEEGFNYMGLQWSEDKDYF
ncbi:MAG: lipo-like protein, partial [Pseudomonadota bacterium]